ncbi:hypothetical protein L218DRAFT_1079338 [Marasmius fiardii PR-910]|nr:hypothetical protein L218DRAFT_1079338 [Marasmius fiardii PR-910]
MATKTSEARGHKRKEAEGSSHTSVHLENLSTQARDELLQLYEYIPEKSLEAFFCEYLPSIEDKIVSKTVKKLRKSREVVGIVKERDVYGHATTTSGGPNKQEKVTSFRDLCDCLQQITNLAIELEGHGNKAWIAYGPKQTRIQGERARSSHPDSYFYLQQTAPAVGDGDHIVGWEQLLAVGQFKKYAKNENDNWARVLWGMHNIMRNDPCRLFTFGYSVEGDQARLWYHARSCVVVSEKFNWVTNPEPFMKLVLVLFLMDSKYFPRTALDTEEGTLTLTPEVPTSALTVASTNKAKDGMESLYREHPDYLRRIGMDPAMQRVVDSDGKIQYRFRVKGVAKGETCVKEHVFITEDVLCDWKADCGTGRATRVWIVYREGDSDPQKQKFVLKDVWLEVGAETEGDKLDQLEKDVEHLGLEEPKLKQWFKDHFLHKHVDQKIGQHVPGVLDGSSYISLPSPDSATAIRAKVIRSGSQRTVACGGPPSPQMKKDSTPEFPDRFHYRIVFQDAMISLEAVSNRLEASEVVMGVLRACWVLWKCKRVHRDVSSGNALWDPKTKTGRLADYDYVTEYGKPGTGTAKTGTPHFWSIEVEAGKYLYLPTHDERPYKGRLLSEDELIARLRPLGFYHNLLHDLESVYWVSFWTMLWLVGDEDKDKNENNEVVNETRQLLASTIFCTASESERRDFIQLEDDRIRIFQQYGPNGIRSDDLRQAVLAFHFHQMPRALASLFNDSQVNLRAFGKLSHDDPVFQNAFDAMETLLRSLHNAQKTRNLLESKVEPIYASRATLDKEDGSQQFDQPTFYPGQSEDDELDDGPNGFSETTGPSHSKRPKLDSTGSSV